MCFSCRVCMNGENVKRSVHVSLGPLNSKTWISCSVDWNSFGQSNEDEKEHIMNTVLAISLSRANQLIPSHVFFYSVLRTDSDIFSSISWLGLPAEKDYWLQSHWVWLGVGLEVFCWIFGFLALNSMSYQGGGLTAYGWIRLWLGTAELSSKLSPQ